MAHVGDDLLSGIRAVVHRRALPLATRRLTIETSRPGRDAGLAGGTVLAVDHALPPDGMRMLVRRGLDGTTPPLAASVPKPDFLTSERSSTDTARSALQGAACPRQGNTPTCSIRVIVSSTFFQPDSAGRRRL
jgi:hypothetical protein